MRVVEPWSVFEAGLAKGRQDRREGGWERALTPQAQVDGKEPRCNGESEPPRRALSPGPEGRGEVDAW